MKILFTALLFLASNTFLFGQTNPNPFNNQKPVTADTSKGAKPGTSSTAGAPAKTTTATTTTAAPKKSTTASKTTTATTKTATKATGTTTTKAATADSTKNNLIVYAQTKEAYQEVQVSSKGAISITKLPDTLSLVLPDKNYTNYSIQFNNDKSKFVMSFNCGGEGSCVQFPFSCIQNGVIKLTFDNGYLISVSPKRQITGTTPYIQIIDSAAAKKVVKTICDSFPDKGIVENELTADTSTVKKYSAQFFPYTDCSCCKIKTKCDKDTCMTISICDLYNERFLFVDKSKPTPKYRIVYDARPGILQPLTFLKYKKNKDGIYEYRKKTNLSPFAGKTVLVTVIGSKDSVYNIDNTSTQLFTENMNQVLSTLQPSASTDTSKNKSAATTASTNGISNKAGAAGAETTLNADSSILAKYNPAKYTLAHKMAVFDSIAPGSNISKLKTASAQLGSLIDAYIALQIQMENLLKLSNSTLQTNQQLAEQIATLENEIKELPDAKVLKANLLALDDAINRIINKYNDMDQYCNVDFIHQAYARDIENLKSEIAYKFGITAPDNGTDLVTSLIKTAKTEFAQENYIGLCEIFKSIQADYDSLLKYQFQYVQYSIKEISVPNADIMHISIKTKKDTVDLMKSYSFNVSGGFKIDFSTGVFISGIVNPVYTLEQEGFKYEVVKDSVGKNGNYIPVYTGKVADTSGALIHTDMPKISFGTGFFTHAYFRTGTFCDVGLALGVVLNNNAQVQGILGLSVMFNAGVSRIALVGGLTVGQETILSSEDWQYQYAPYDYTNTPLPSENALPHFFPGNTPDTYTKWVSSWLFGVTYNFATK